MIIRLIREKMRKVIVASTIMLLLLFPIATVRATPGTIQLIGKEWDHDNLKVYIKVSPKLQDYISDVLVALNDWSTALEGASENTVDNSEIGGEVDGIFDFQLVDSSREADIVITLHRGTFAGVLGMAILQDKDNDGYFDKVKISVTVGSGVATREQVRNVLRHELGHGLGLGHSDDPGDLMYPTYDASSVNVDVLPSSLDVNALLHIYYNDGFGLPNLPPEMIPPSYSE